MATIYDKLRERYPAPEWAIFFEVANGPGSHLRRYADAIAMSLFPSRGLDIHGFEVKAKRSDWLRELKDPLKAEEIAAFCDFWWIVAESEAVALKEEVPANWGLLVQRGDELRVVKRSERLDPAPLDRKFVAALLRRSDEWVKRELLNDERVVKAREEGRAAGVEERGHTQSYELDELRRMKQEVTEFERRSGLKVAAYGGEEIGDAVKAFLHARDVDSAGELEESAGQIERSAQVLRDRAQAIRGARSPAPARELGT